MGQPSQLRTNRRAIPSFGQNLQRAQLLHNDYPDFIGLLSLLGFVTCVLK